MLELSQNYEPSSSFRVRSKIYWEEPKKMIYKKWHYWLVLLFFGFIYANGIYDFFMMLSHSQSYYQAQGYGDDVHAYFRDYPLGPLILWGVNIFGSALSVVLLLFRSKWVVGVSLVSALSMTILFGVTFFCMNRWEILGTFTSIFDLFLLLITWLFYLYCRFLLKRSYLK